MPTLPRVIVVDDEPSICSLVRDILEHAGYSVVTVTTSHAALDVVKGATRFALAIIDVVMPAMSGDELATAMRAVDPDLKVLFLTGYPGALFQARPRLWDGEAFLEKPCSDKALLEAVSLLLTARIAAASESTGTHVGSSGDPEPLF